MKIEVLDLTSKNLKDLPEWESHPFSCKYCIYWEFKDEIKDPSKETKEEFFKKKIKWLENTRKLFGECGKILYVDKKAIGYAQYAPAEFLPNSFSYPSGPPSSDAVIISCLFILKKEFQGLGLGKALLQSIIDDLKKRNIKAVETFARKNSPENPSGPVDFYLKNGFKILREDSEFPLLRLEL